MSVEHLVLTRFNVRVGYSEGRHLDTSWLADRFALFEAFCLPSIVGQTCGPPKWLVLFDSETPVRFKNRIHQLAELGHFEPIYVDDFASLDLDHLIRTHADPMTDVVITSRIDNDDAYASDYCERVLAAYESETPMVLNFTEGYVLELASGQLFEKQHASNPFVSVAEPLQESVRLMTAFGSEHNRWQSVLPITQIAGGPGWMVVVHGRNVSNSVASDKRVRLADARRRFDLPGVPRGRAWSITHHPANLVRWVRRIARAWQG